MRVKRKKKQLRYNELNNKILRCDKDLEELKERMAQFAQDSKEYNEINEILKITYDFRDRCVNVLQSL